MALWGKNSLVDIIRWEPRIYNTESESESSTINQFVGGNQKLWHINWSLPAGWTLGSWYLSPF